MARIIYPSVSDLIEVNRIVLEQIKVSKADRSGLLAGGMGILEETVKKMQNKKGDIYDKVMVLFEGIIRNHPFSSGNRRTGIVSTAAFMEVNGKELNIVKETGIIQGVRERYYKKSEIKKWLKGGEVREFDRFH